ncbi:MAG: 30S ribosome-binding factor RbfA [Acidiferrobacterales bacterium]|jgi:ribosome-binding factor A
MHSQSNRQRRVAELLKRELAVLIQHELNDPRVHGVTLTGAEVASDLSTAKVYFSCLAGFGEKNKSMTVLNKASSFLRHRLMSRLALRGIPRLHFVYDTSVEEGTALSTLIDRAVAEDKDRQVD